MYQSKAKLMEVFYVDEGDAAEEIYQKEITYSDPFELMCSKLKLDEDTINEGSSGYQQISLFCGSNLFIHLLIIYLFLSFL